MTGVFAPVSGVGARISGSTFDGGQMTPSVCASLSLSGAPWPTVPLDESWDEFGLAFCDGGQARGSVASAFGVAGCGAAGAGGVAGVGGAWAIAISGAKHATIAAKRRAEFRMKEQRHASPMVPLNSLVAHDLVRKPLHTLR